MAEDGGWSHVVRMGVAMGKRVRMRVNVRRWVPTDTVWNRRSNGKTSEVEWFARPFPFVVKVPFVHVTRIQAM